MSGEHLQVVEPVRHSEVRPRRIDPGGGVSCEAAHMRLVHDEVFHRDVERPVTLHRESRPQLPQPPPRALRIGIVSMGTSPCMHAAHACVRMRHGRAPCRHCRGRTYGRRSAGPGLTDAWRELQAVRGHRTSAPSGAQSHRHTSAILASPLQMRWRSKACRSLYVVAAGVCARCMHGARMHGVRMQGARMQTNLPIEGSLVWVRQR